MKGSSLAREAVDVDCLTLIYVALALGYHGRPRPPRERGARG